MEGKIETCRAIGSGRKDGWWGGGVGGLEYWEETFQSDKSVYVGKQMTLHQVTFPPNLIPLKMASGEISSLGIHLRIKKEKKKPLKIFQKKKKKKSF